MKTKTKFTAGFQKPSPVPLSSCHRQMLKFLNSKGTRYAFDAGGSNTRSVVEWAIKGEFDRHIQWFIDNRLPLVGWEKLQEHGLLNQEQVQKLSALSDQK